MKASENWSGSDAMAVRKLGLTMTSLPIEMVAGLTLKPKRNSKRCR